MYVRITLHCALPCYSEKLEYAGIGNGNTVPGHATGTQHASPHSATDSEVQASHSPTTASKTCTDNTSACYGLIGNMMMMMMMMVISMPALQGVMLLYNTASSWQTSPHIQHRSCLVVA
jgi:hypothetical protein